MNDKYRKPANNYYRAINEEDRVDYLKQVILQDQKINSFYEKVYSDVEEKINDMVSGNSVHTLFFHWMTANDEDIEWLGSESKSKKVIIQELRETYDIPTIISHQKKDLGELEAIRMYYWGEKLFFILHQIALESNNEPNFASELLEIEENELKELLLEENFKSLSKKINEVNQELESKKSKGGSNVIDFQKYKENNKSG